MADTPEKGDKSKKVDVASTSPLAQARKLAEQKVSAGRGKQVSPQQFFQEAWIELKKTTWPSQDVLIKSTTVVLALVLAVAIWVGGLDYLFGKTLSAALVGTTTGRP